MASKKRRKTGKKQANKPSQKAGKVKQPIKKPLKDEVKVIKQTEPTPEVVPEKLFKRVQDTLTDNFKQARETFVKYRLQVNNFWQRQEQKFSAFKHKVKAKIRAGFNYVTQSWPYRVVRATVLAALIFIFSATLFISVVLVVLNLVFGNRITLNTYVAGVSLGGLNYNQALSLLQEKYAGFEKEGLVFTVQGTAYNLSLPDLGLNLFLAETVGNSMQRGHGNNFWQNQFDLLSALFVSQEIELVSDLKADQVKAALEKYIAEVKVPPVNAWVILNENNEFEVTPSRESQTTDFILATKNIYQALHTLENSPIELPLEIAYPEIVEEEAYSALTRANEVLQQDLVLNYTQHGRYFEPWVIDLAEDKNWLDFYIEESALAVYLKRDLLSQYLHEKVVPAINQVHQDAILTFLDEAQHKVEVEGIATDGYTLEIDETTALIDESIELNNYTIELPVSYIQGRILSQSGEDLGLNDILSVGETDFSGSSWARIHNIDLGLSKVNNILLKPGEEYSHLTFLGAITAAVGYKAELVIKEGGRKTVPETGGGLCQTSSTAYRAALYAGFPITARTNHSYAVSYYTPWGLDATIYSPNPDFKFVNDSGNNILIQAYTSGNKAYMKIYGTHDGRQVEMVSSGTYAHRGAGYVEEVSAGLALGQSKITKYPHSGFQVDWTRTITYADGEVAKEVFHSNYRAIPGLKLIGGGAASSDQLSMNNP